MTTPQTETDPQTTLPFRKKKGRPFRDPARNRPVDQAAAEMADKLAIPPPPAKKLSFDQAQEYFKLLTPDMWSHVIMYLYRTRPRIIRQLRDPDAKNYIDVLSQPIDMDYMIRCHGGGGYELVVNDSEAKREQQNLFRCLIEVDQNRYEPKLEYAEVDVNHRDNMSYVRFLQSKGILSDKGQVVTSQPASNSGGMNADIMKHMVDLVSTMNANTQEAIRSRLASAEDNNLSKSIGQILVERMKQDNPSQHLEVANAIVGAFEKGAAANKPAAPDISIVQILQMQNEQRKTDLEYMKLMLESRTQPPQDANVSRLREVLDFARELSQISRNNSGPGDRNAWDIGLDYAKELVIPGLNTLNNYLALKRGVPPSPIGTGPGSPTAARAFDPYRDSAAMRAASLAAQQQNQPAAAPAPAPAPQPRGAFAQAQAAAATAPPPPGEPAAAPGNAQLLPVLQQYGNLVVNALNNETTGFDFADYIVGLLGAGTHAALIAEGEDGLLRTAMMAPELAIYGETRLRTFIHEFVHYKQYLQEADGIDEQD